MSVENGDSPAIPATEIVYLNYDGNFELECVAKVVKVVETKKEGEDGVSSIAVSLDKTVLHAQGGGQPTDIGKITVVKADNGNTATSISISKVLLDRSNGVVSHMGTIDSTETTTIQVGDTVHVQVDKDNRAILSECHTAGHVVDSAMARCGLQMKPTKGFHFLDGPYVEYAGKIPPEEKEEKLQKLQAAFQELVDEDISTKIELLSKNEANEMCNRIAQNFDMNIFCNPITEQVRVVTVAGFPCPCGGTHVKSTSILKQNGWGIIGMKSKKGVVRIRYGQNATK